MSPLLNITLKSYSFWETPVLRIILIPNIKATTTNSGKFEKYVDFYQYMIQYQTKQGQKWLAVREKNTFGGERDREIVNYFSSKALLIKHYLVYHKTPKSMSYRDTAYLNSKNTSTILYTCKICLVFFTNMYKPSLISSSFLSRSIFLTLLWWLIHCNI